MRRFRNFVLKWLFIFAVIIGAGLWFIYSNWLTQYQWIANGKHYASSHMEDYYQQQKNAAIHGIKQKIGLEDAPNVQTAGNNIGNNNNGMSNSANASSGIGANAVNVNASTNTNGNTNIQATPASGASLSPNPASTPVTSNANSKNNQAASAVNASINSNNSNINPADSDNSVAIDAQAQAFPHISIPFFYDHSAAPANMTEQQVLTLLNRASQTWNQACNVSFDFKGDRLADYVDINNVINRKEGIVKWSSMDGDRIGQAHQGSAAGPAHGFVLTLNPVFFGKKANQDNLYSTVLHEMGHVIGLNHSKNPNSIMFWQEDNLHRQVLNSSDKAMCLYLRGRWSGMTAAQASDKFGVLFNESVTPEEDSAQSSNGNASGDDN